MKDLNEILKDRSVCASSPCRIDFAGTLDIASFAFVLSDLCPVTFNMAMDLRTRVTLSGYKKGVVKVSSTGFESAEFESKKAPYNHPLGLIFAIADSFSISGVHIEIESASPPRSALGGSSVVSVALVALIMRLINRKNYRVRAKDVAVCAHLIESAVAGVPCGIQDHLAAAYGGANAWHWNSAFDWFDFNNTSLARKEEFELIQNNFLVVYTGKTHDSHSVNTKWRNQFINGEYRDHWAEIVNLSHDFCKSFLEKDFAILPDIVKKEVSLRLELTPNVLDKNGKLLYDLAVENNCGARFTGAGAGGCMWAVGQENDIKELKKCWEKEIAQIKGACILDIKPDPNGIIFEDNN